MAMTSTSNPIIEITDLRKSYGPTVAVDGISLRVRRGEVFGVLGPNGGGKRVTRRPNPGDDPAGGTAREGQSPEKLTAILQSIIASASMML